jgi:hypothetical protein
MMSIIRRFFAVLPSLVIQSYREYESVQMTNGILVERILLIVV